MEELDLREKGKASDGSTIHSDRRLFVQMLAFTGCTDVTEVIEASRASGLDIAIYEDVNDPQGIGFVSMSPDPNEFVDKVRPLLQSGPFAKLTPLPDFTMLGRSYSIGYEDDLDHVLVNRPRGRMLNPDLNWVIWYPLRRSGAFAQLDHKEQMKILGEHGMIGRAYGEAGYAQDIRLACFGLDRDDNDFVIGLLGNELFPLSHVVQRMRKTVQTSQYIEKLGPFFVGRVVFQSQA